MKINKWVVLHLGAAVLAKSFYAQQPTLLMGALVGANLAFAFCSFMHVDIVDRYAGKYFEDLAKEREEKQK